MEYDRSLGEGQIKGKSQTSKHEIQSLQLYSIKQNIVCGRGHVSWNHPVFSFMRF